MKTSSKSSQPVKHLSSQQVLAIHYRMVKRFGGSQGLRDISLLESAVGRPQASFEGIDLYPSIFEKGAALMHSILKNHPFVDGNKRTAYASTGIFLELNGYALANMHKESLQFCLRVENGSVELEEIAAWLRNNSKATSGK